ncbi:class C sortase [Changpingibacter yushuensis]|uniref:class C sortase n=1 Tax=Changpingibacter yushuensis TaxID=2758440 RepID=UPI0015F5C709|nr:class C sortase [Changpingibacter yushuensis]
MSVDTATTGNTVHKDRTWRFPWLPFVACLVILAGVGLFLYPHAASWFSQKEQSRVTELAQEALESPPYDDASYRDNELSLAHAYNDALASGAVYRANERLATGQGDSTALGFTYDDLLNNADHGFMGRLQYSALDIDLPIYHGTSDETLAIGVGHLEGTSLPVGGVGTRSVLTAHRGLPSATLFTHLDQAKVGDTFTISVLDQVLTYKVIEFQVIEPSETKEILADPDRDLVTLVTCTPLGINSHRILVTGERISPTPLQDVTAAQATSDLPGFPWWAVALGGSLIIAAVYIWRSGYSLGPAKPIGEDQAL